MHFLVAVRAAIADDQQSVVRIGGMAQGREYDAAGSDPRQDQGLDAVGAQHQVEMVPAKALTRCLVTTISSASGRAFHRADVPTSIDLPSLQFTNLASHL